MALKLVVVVAMDNCDEIFMPRHFIGTPSPINGYRQQVLPNLVVVVVVVGFVVGLDVD